MNRNYKHQQLLNILSDIKMFLKVIKRVEMNKNYNGFAIIKKKIILLIVKLIKIFTREDRF